MTRAIIYVRQSLDRSGEGLAVERQRQACEELCNARGWTIADTLVENDTSALRKRPVFDDLLQRVERREVDVIVVWHVDRLVRQLAQLEHIIELCEKTGTKLATVSGELDLSTDTGRLLARILASVARGEVERKGTRQRKANAQRAAEGLPHAGGHRAFGYTQDGMTLVEEEAKAIRTAYEHILAGGSLRGVARDWNEHSLFSGKPRWASDNAEPSQWKFASVREVLMNARNCGIRQYAGEEYPGRWPAIVPEEVYRAAVVLLSDPARRPVGSYGVALLTKVAACGVCGAHVHSGGGNLRGKNIAEGKRYRTYRCSDSPGRHIVRKAEPIDELVTRLVIGRLSAPDAADLLTVDEKPDVPALIAERASIGERQRMLAEEFADGTLTPAQIRVANERLAQRLQELDAEIAEAGRTSILAPLIAAQDVAEAWDALNIDRKRLVIAELVSIRILPTGRGVRTFRPESVEIRWRKEL